jgi:hypothetical protein
MRDPAARKVKVQAGQPSGRPGSPDALELRHDPAGLAGRDV